MRIKTSADRARALVLSIPHKTCARAAGDRWKVSLDGTVRAQSVLWLYCWAKTGMNSEEARQVAVQAFDEVLPIGFVDFDAAVDHAYARKRRYASVDIEGELDEILTRIE